MTVVLCTYELGIGTPPMTTLSRWSLSRLFVVAVVPVAVAAVVAKAAAEARARALAKSKGAYLATFSSTDDFCSKATVSSGDEAEEGEEEEQATGDENEEGNGESLGSDEEDERDEALDFIE